ncbi:MAG: hypothetical protein ACXWCY_29325 [Burkholderiales bacterium]
MPGVNVFNRAIAFSVSHLWLHFFTFQPGGTAEPQHLNFFCFSFLAGTL